MEHELICTYVVVDWSSNVGILVLSIRSRSWGSRVGSADKGSEKNLNNIRHEILCTAINQIYIFHTQIWVDEFLQYLVKAKNSCCVGEFLAWILWVWFKYIFKIVFLLQNNLCLCVVNLQRLFVIAKLVLNVASKAL